MQERIRFDLVFSGYDSDGRYHLTESRDALPPNLASFHESSIDISPALLRQAIIVMENEGHECLVQLGSFYHETGE